MSSETLLEWNYECCEVTKDTCKVFILEDTNVPVTPTAHSPFCFFFTFLPPVWWSGQDKHPSSLLLSFYHLGGGGKWNEVFLCVGVISSAHRSWCCRLWSRPDFHPGPFGDRSPVCKTTWSLCPSAVVLHTEDTTQDKWVNTRHMPHVTFKYVSFNSHQLQLADL